MKGEKVKTSDNKFARLALVIRWTARVWSILSIAALLLPFVMEGLIWMYANSLREILGHVCYMSILVGLILSWFKEGVGGAITTTSLVLFYLIFWATGRTPTGPYFILIAAPGFLFLIYWLLGRAQHNLHHTA
jgi:hypothetical protein